MSKNSAYNINIIKDTLPFDFNKLKIIRNADLVTSSRDKWRWFIKIFADLFDVKKFHLLTAPLSSLCVLAPDSYRDLRETFKISSGINMLH